jgi:Cof subfamily protein (haloacid dehalogenase superfamily)
VTATALVAIDLDGTLIGQSLEISDVDRRAVTAARDAGVTVCIATGRLFSAARPFAQELGLDGLLIPLNGAAVYEIVTGEIVHAVPLGKDIALDSLDALRAAGFRVQLYFDDRMFLDGSDARSDTYVRMSRIQPVMVPDLRALLTDRPPPLPGPMKVLGIGSEADVAEQVTVLGAKFGRRANVFRSQRQYLEVTDIGADKGSALAWVAQRSGVGLEAVAAIGDSDNDVPMFERSGRSYAVSSGTALAKGRAGRVVGPQGTGVAEALGEILAGAAYERA